MKLADLLPYEVRLAIADLGYDIVKIGETPWWMERVHSLPAELYRMKALDSD